MDDTAGRVADRLIARYGYPALLRDLFRQANELPPEPEARRFLEAQMERVAAQVVVIGPRWLEGIARPNDLVRVQIEAALRRQLPIIPLLAEGATMPSATQLPPELASFALFNAAQARLDPDFDADSARLLATIERYAPTLPIQRAPAFGATQMTPGGALDAKEKRRPWPFRTPLRIGSSALVSASLLYLVVALALTLPGGGAPAAALNATPAPTATYLATPSAPGAYYATLTDGMPDWMTGGQCKPESDGLHLVKSDSGCGAPSAANAGDGDLSVTVRQISGPTNEPYGLYFRSGGFGGKFYGFEIASNGAWVAYKELYTSSTVISPWRYSSAIHTGLGATNVIEARFQGPRLTFLVNGQQVGAVSDSSIPAQGTAGDPGLFTGDGLFGQASIEVVYINYRLKPIA